MAILSSILRGPLPATRRAYSIFSKPGGGRYFNSSKPPTSASAASKGKVEAATANANGEVTSSGPTVDEAASQPPASINSEAKPATPSQSLGVNFTPYPASLDRVTTGHFYL
ncbi:hypothetical protein NM688_g3393 [Phlebia brevispora]|uniref:Uncharacterized protein n=1 Tax=Phlebia brevispora TaxID=194682 RepID=A0ACC1T632_9APHY|nr:hypothetical protein NM688_g3393 [Phlebia brevispora]